MLPNQPAIGGPVEVGRERRDLRPGQLRGLAVRVGIRLLRPVQFGRDRRHGCRSVGGALLGKPDSSNIRRTSAASPTGSAGPSEPCQRGQSAGSGVASRTKNGSIPIASRDTAISAGQARACSIRASQMFSNASSAAEPAVIPWRQEA